MNKELLKDLVLTYTPSGEEWRGYDLIKSWGEKQGLKLEYKDLMGNIGFKLGNGPRKILISGHIDEICLQVLSITEDGFLICSNGGGFDVRTLPGSIVKVLQDYGNQNEDVTGVIQSIPIHVYAGDEDLRNKPFSLLQLRVDIGCESRKEVEMIGIHPGSYVCTEHDWIELGKNRIAGNSLDDKAGTFIALEAFMYALERKDNLDLNAFSLYAVACTGEETGLRGAKVVAHNINPEISIDVDVYHGNNNGLLKKEKYGNLKLGGGPILTYGADKSTELNGFIEYLAMNGYKDVQKMAARNGGTNTDSFQLYSQNCLTTHLSIPLLSMHTPTETMDWRDIEDTAELLGMTVEHLMTPEAAKLSLLELMPGEYFSKLK